MRQETLCWLDNGEFTIGVSLPYLEAKTLRGSKEATIVKEGMVVDKGTKVILVDGENSGEIFEVKVKGVMGSTFKIFSCVSSIEQEYLLLLFDLYRELYRNTKVGAAIPHLNKKLFKETLVSLPPLAEQKRIVAAFKDIDLLITEYARYEQAEAELDEKLPDRLRKSILQYAIEGKLVPQDLADEPASVLLERIRKEKESLVKAGKIKRNKTESVIYKTDDNSYYEKLGENAACIDNELPFEIPENWAWCRLGSIVDFSKSTSAAATEIHLDAWVLDLEDIEKDTGKLLAKKRMKEIAAKSNKHAFKAGDVLYSKLRPYLNKVIIADESGYCTSEILVFSFGEILNEYAKIFLMSPFFVDYAMRDAYGVKMPRLGSQQGNAALMPIPPQCEQRRICAAIELALDQLNLLKH